ncbi:MAG: sigma-70 family RNA polymerase sigma factor [Isosphaeraceae bacterium]|nr:sigma-70 family RNA polymerase sigma factor [Isosphaeraceae bacterium]
MSQSTGDSELHSRTSDLFARAQAGDQAAWEELFKACNPKIRRAVKRKLNPALRSLYDSSDFASDVWKSLAAKADRFDFPSLDALMAFLVQAVHQKIIDEHRRQHALKNDIERNRALEEMGDGGFELPSSDPTPSQEALANEVRERLLDREDGLERTVLELKIEQHLSNEEVAERTGLHVRKVQRFLKQLRESLAAAGG